MQKAYEGLGKYASVLEGGVHPKHRLMNYHQFFVDNVELNEVVLDLGCGNGLVALDVAKKAKDVVGVDLNEDNINAAHNNQQKRKCENVNFLVADALEEEFNIKFDKIILSNILEHIENRVDFLVRIRDLASTILIRVPMLNRDWTTLYKKELGMEYRLDKTHYVEYTVECLDAELREAGWMLDKYSVQYGELWGVANVWI